MNLKQLLAFLAAVLLALPASAQETPPASTRAPAAPAQPGAMEMQGMDRMSDSVTKMSEMCQMMMKKEMAAMCREMMDKAENN